MRERLKKNFDSHHKASSLKPLDLGVCVPDMSPEGKIITKRVPYSYITETPSGTFRRNRQHIILMPANSSGEASTNKSEETSENSIDSIPSGPECHSEQKWTYL